MSSRVARPTDPHRPSARRPAGPVIPATPATPAGTRGPPWVRDADFSDPVIAELQRAKAAAEAASEAKSRYLVAVSHEIRSPLNAIYGYAQLLERGDAVTGSEAGAAIRRSVEHLTNLAESLLEISRIESGVLKIRSGVVDVHALLGQILSMFRAQAIAKGLSLTLDIGKNLPVLVKTDQKRLRQVLINLVSNAIKYTPTGGVGIVVHYRNEVATIDVVDTGIGIEPGDIERIFEPFERGSASGVLAQPGIGLGLTITRVLAQVLGGDILATSTPGEGSRFRLKLMLSPALPVMGDADAAAVHVEGYQGPRRKVLVVEDDPEQCAAMQSLLESLDFIVHVARTGADAIGQAARCVPDAVLLDVEMPGISGWETARRLREVHGSRLKIVMVSACTVAVETHEADDLTHDAFVAKPIAFDALFATMQQQLGLQWNYVEVASSPDLSRQEFPVPEGARVHLERLRKYAQIGHVLGFEKELEAFERAVPDAAPFIAVLRGHLHDFDFSASIGKIEHALAR